MTTHDIHGIAEIRTLVDAFYIKVRKDALLGPVFEARISDWDKHLQIMYRFWNAALFQVREYTGNPFAAHASLPVETEHFRRWIELFFETLDERFEGPVTEDAKRRATIMANTFNRRIHEMRSVTRHQPLNN